ncbi:MAG: helicase-exonuclease AddAB subunit AddA [Lachnospiraceae bacterium]|nr:helicase-exonuclease AddAB subunit AddA [Lachnospiraceae bacterium]
MGMKFTPEQQRVIDLRNCNILVSAAAGSGKTAVLVERIVQRVSDPAAGCDIDRLLVVTFTNAAAAQMRERLSAALSRKAEEDPDNGHLQRQLTLVHNAQITTIDSFCLQLIKNHFNDIGLDPDFCTADDGEMKLMRRDVLKALLEEEFARKTPEFLHCVECFTPGGLEARLEELILKLYEFAMSYPWPERWLLDHREDYAVVDVSELEQQPWYGELKKSVDETLKECRQQNLETLKLCEQPDGPHMYAAALEADRELIEGLCRNASDLDSLSQRLETLSFAKLSTKKDLSVSVEKREQAKKERERVKGMLSGLKQEYLSASMENQVQDMHKASAALQTLVDLTLAFKEKLDCRKREKNLLDFHDMEHMALQILIGEDGKPTRTAQEYREYFKEILIDEYQDSNLVQEFLLQSISGEEEGVYNRFMVGDVKQSIYKFRLARPELFMEKFDTYTKEDGDCVRVDLKRNFRSRHEVTDCVNDVFYQIMHRELGGVEYDTDAALYPAAQFPEPLMEEETGAADQNDVPMAKQKRDMQQSVYEPEFLIALSDRDEENDRVREARMIAERMHQLVGKFPVRDKETGELRPAQYKDMVILLRTTSGWDEEFKNVLQKSQIPVHVTSKTGYFAAQEIQNVLNFLRVLDNPLQDIPLFGVLHSVIGNFSDEEIALLRTADETQKRSLYECMKSMASKEEAGLSKKCQQFAELIGRFREYAVYLPIHSLMEKFLEETGYLYTVSAMPGGSQRKTNVEMLLAKAESYEKTSYTGLFHFIRYIEQLEKYDVDYGEAGMEDENADVVRIMSIHKSKGLEFPICFVAGLSKRFNRQDAVQPVIMDMDLGLATDCLDPVARTKKGTLKKSVLAQKLVADSLGEELRVLYVAMTRAEEKLILTACCRPDKGPRQDALAVEKKQLLAISPVRLLETTSFYDIVLPAWQAAGRAVTCMDTSDFLQEELSRTAEGLHTKQALQQLIKDGSQKRKKSDEEAEPMTKQDEIRLKLLRRMNSPYLHENLKDLFVKTTVSELKKAGMQEELEPGAELFAEPEIIPYLPRFVREQEEEVTGSARGSAYHRLLQLWPFESDETAWNRQYVQNVMEEKQRTGELTAEYGAVIRPWKIASFLGTKLAHRMHLSAVDGLLRKEQPFVLGICASQLKPNLPESETVLIQGIIDVFFEEDGELVLADYKTDAVKEPWELVRRYQIQLDYYAQALEQLCGKKVKEKIIYSFALEQEIYLK